MSFLLDTNVVSELRKGARADARVRAWFAGVDIHGIASRHREAVDMGGRREQ